MSKGTTSQGPRNDKTHTQCRRCGRKSFHRQNKKCGACGYPNRKMRRYDGNTPKVRTRKGEGSGQMRYKKDIPRRFRNKFRTVNNYLKALPEKRVSEKKERSNKITRRRLK